MHSKNTEISSGFPFSQTGLGKLGSGTRISGKDRNIVAARLADHGPVNLPAQNRPETSRIKRHDRAAPTAQVAPTVGARRINTPPSPVLLPLATYIWGASGTRLGPRTRPEHSVIWVTRGRNAVSFPRRDHRMGPGDLRYIPAGTAYSCTPMVDSEGYVALIPSRLTEQFGAVLPGDGLSGHIGSVCDPLLSCLRALTDKENGSTAPALQRLAEIFEHLQPAIQGHARHMPNDVQDRPLVERFISLARDHPLEQVSVSELATALGSNLTTLDRACMAARGQRAVEILNAVRLELAIIMLRGKRLAPAAIATRLGYSSLTHFTRAVVDATGQTPDAFQARADQLS
ncbi:AraC family transcriptional regulator [Paracoccus sp. Z330]|uniref:AraC family transcriptional regulator n=1 Tax=Paracoccus onchidii TaxID=3017813 RepID=A0ABT4ZGM3_9RHOB|nr:AraC family transcriptional regulator [Paracoccus onchidii]MDB6178513.1 AraC family transcriptional regulator [Paracoccus onchidii]